MLFHKTVHRFRVPYWLKPWQNIDWTLLILTTGLTFFGGIMIRSTELHRGQTDWWAHWILGAIGVVLVAIISRWRYDILMQWKWIIYTVINLSLIAVMFIGTSALGAERWINIAGFHVQPSEFAKLGIIITLAAILHNQGAASVPAVAKALGITSVTWILVFIQPNLGTSLVFGSITFGMLYWAGANPGWLLLLISPFISAIICNAFLHWWFFWVPLMGFIAWRTLPWPWLSGLGAIIVNLVSGQLGHILWGLLKPYQKDRLLLFLNPDKDPLGGGYHLIQSRIAIGAGQIWGRGLNQGTQTQLDFIPEQHTDFIFSAVGEELGFVGCVVVLMTFWLICLRLIIIAQNSKDNFGSLIAIGVLSMIVFQMIVNIGMTIGLAPITGIPLPWLSYGRSSMLTNFLAIGIVESVANYSQRSKKFSDSY